MRCWLGRVSRISHAHHNWYRIPFPEDFLEILVNVSCINSEASSSASSQIASLAGTGYDTRYLPAPRLPAVCDTFRYDACCALAAAFLDLIHCEPGALLSEAVLECCCLSISADDLGHLDMAVILKLTSRRGTCSDAKPGLFALVTLLIWRLSTVATADTFTCPSTVLNATWGTCKLPCQQAICEALASFYESTNLKASSTSPGSWRQQRGWTELENLACRILVAEDGTGSAPVYCSWHGVTCCSAALRSSGYCTVNNSVWGLQLPVNGLTGSLEGMQLQRSLAQLHACGLMKLNLAGNALSGSLDNFCARLPRLITLNLSTCSIETRVISCSSASSA